MKLVEYFGTVPSKDVNLPFGRINRPSNFWFSLTKTYGCYCFFFFGEGGGETVSIGLVYAVERSSQLYRKPCFHIKLVYRSVLFAKEKVNQ
jgi:hypothetical protein